MPDNGIAPGFALDITCNDEADGQPLDFSLKVKRDRARALLRDQKPMVLIGSPMCKAWSAWQRINNLKRDVNVIRREMIEARVHLRFVVELYREQIEGGRYFIHEHPLHAASWEEEEIKELMDLPGVVRAHGDQCQYGAGVVSGIRKGAPVKKPTGFLTNGKCIAAALSR